MIIDSFKNLFYSVKSSCICNFLLGIAMLDIIVYWLPHKSYDTTSLIMSLIISFSIGILPALSYNLIRFRMVKSGELNYGLWRYTLSAVLPFIAPMLIYGIAYLNGFRFT